MTCRHRADFLGHMKPSDVKGNNSITGPASGNWTLVDEGGEEVRRSIIKPKMKISAQPCQCFIRECLNSYCYADFY